MCNNGRDGIRGSFHGVRLGVRAVTFFARQATLHTESIKIEKGGREGERDSTEFNIIKDKRETHSEKSLRLFALLFLL